jgi:hypothetical protein
LQIAYRLWTQEAARRYRQSLTQAACRVLNSLTLAEMPAKHIAGFVLVAILQEAPPRRTEGRCALPWPPVQWAERFPHQQRAFDTAGARQTSKSDRRPDQDN